MSRFYKVGNKQVYRVVYAGFTESYLGRFYRVGYRQVLQGQI
jgi:hypothetical protein